MIPDRVKTALRKAQREECAGTKPNGEPCRRDLKAMERAYKEGWMRKYLGRGRSAVEFDHIVPRAQGGTDDESNIQALCGLCHDDKTKGERPDWEAPSPSAFANRIAARPEARAAACGHGAGKPGKPGKVARLRAGAANKSYAR